MGGRRASTGPAKADGCQVAHGSRCGGCWQCLLQALPLVGAEVSSHQLSVSGSFQYGRREMSHSRVDPPRHTMGQQRGLMSRLLTALQASCNSTSTSYCST